MEAVTTDGSTYGVTDSTYGVTTVSGTGTTAVSGVALIFIVIFFVLFLIFLFILTYYLDVRNKFIGCQSDQNIWCYNDWTCNNTVPCPTGTNVCFTNGGTISPNGETVTPPGLVNCLIGPNSAAAAVCLQTDPCDCTMDNANNCFQGCDGSGLKNPACCVTGNQAGNCNQT